MKTGIAVSFSNCKDKLEKAANNNRWTIIIGKTVGFGSRAVVLFSVVLPSVVMSQFYT